MIPDEIVETMPDLLRTAIEITDTFRDELIAQYGSEGHRALKLVKARIDRADVAVWPDNAAAYRVGYCVLKGANIIRGVSRHGRSGYVAQAAALFQEVGEHSEQ